jgi:hypothetical protein
VGACRVAACAAAAVHLFQRPTVVAGPVMAAAPLREGSQKAYWHRGTGKGAPALPPPTKEAPAKASSTGKATKRVVKKVGKKKVAKKSK